MRLFVGRTPLRCIASARTYQRCHSVHLIPFASSEHRQCLWTTRTTPHTSLCDIFPLLWFVVKSSADIFLNLSVSKVHALSCEGVWEGLLKKMFFVAIKKEKKKSNIFCSQQHGWTWRAWLSETDQRKTEGIPQGILEVPPLCESKASHKLVTITRKS